MTMQAKTLIGIIAIIVWVAAVIGKHFWPDLDTAQLVEGAQAALVGIGVFHITSGSTNTPNSVLEQATVAQSAPVVTILPPGQAGRSLPLYPLVTLILAIIVTLAMGGCASLTQGLGAVNASAVVSVRAANDLQAKVAAEQFCLMSVDTLGRNPSYVKAVQDLCWSGTSTTPSDAAATMQLQSATTLATPVVIK